MLLTIHILGLDVGDPAGSAESANVREKIEMIQRDLERLHSSHRKTGHGSIIAIRECSEGRINVGNQNLDHVVFERRGCR